eukprot:4294963-Prymnesium_polylepis.2
MRQVRRVGKYQTAACGDFKSPGGDFKSRLEVFGRESARCARLLAKVRIACAKKLFSPRHARASTSRPSRPPRVTAHATPRAPR